SKKGRPAPTVMSNSVETEESENSESGKDAVSPEFTEIFYTFNTEKKIVFIGLRGSDLSQIKTGYLSLNIGKENGIQGSYYPNVTKVKRSMEKDFPIAYEIKYSFADKKSELFIAKDDKIFEKLDDFSDLTVGNDYELKFPFSLLNLNNLNKLKFFIHYNSEKSLKMIPEKEGIVMNVSSKKKELLLGSYTDPSGDADGADIRYPLDSMFESATFDIIKFELKEKSGYIDFIIQFDRELTNPWNSPLGFSLQIIDIYIDKDKSSYKLRTLPGRNAEFKKGMEWEYCITVDGWKRSIRDKVFSEIDTDKLKVTGRNDKIILSVPEELIGKYEKSWKFNILVSCFDGYSDTRIRQFTKDGGQWEFKTGSESPMVPKFLDILDSGNQKKNLKSFNDNTIAKIPMVLLSN
ncbi:MAG: hypothetical protein KAS39_08150, partial [Actinomycetia bacterium]|nr:hypothetical protein [Actinomycetes bacterium]